MESAECFKVTFEKNNNMKEQNFKNHAQYVPLYHGLTGGLILTGLIASIVKLIYALIDVNGRVVAGLLMMLFVIAVLFFWFVRAFSLKAQDRAIRAEENLRNFSLTGKLLDSRLRMGQIIALRFAPDDEFTALAARAVNENLSGADIKSAIKNWRPDFNRV